MEQQVVKKKRGRKGMAQEEKVVSITFYVPPRIVTELGGKEDVKRIAKEFLLGLTG